MSHWDPPHLWVEMRATLPSPPLDRHRSRLRHSGSQYRLPKSPSRGPRGVLAIAAARVSSSGLAGPENKHKHSLTRPAESWGCSLPPSSGRAIAAGWKGPGLVLYRTSNNGAQGRQPLQKMQCWLAACCALFRCRSIGGGGGRGHGPTQPPHEST